ncbi:MAG: SET domain-containing protein-lysine N-methyltransferase [Anaerolineae bacterium]|nr:SET domain-containing protein-lysine N-methyltransferase [Anaerolineae bacterium]
MLNRSKNSYLSPKLESRTCPEKGGYGVFAREKIYSGELLTVWGGVVMTEEELEQIPAEISTHGIQVEERVYLVPSSKLDDADMFNHSCDPNAGLSGQIALIAMRDIDQNEEVCFDYAMSDSSDYDEFDCHCGRANCRKKISGADWKLPELQRRYKGYFSPYLQRRIDRLHSLAAQRAGVVSGRQVGLAGQPVPASD